MHRFENELFKDGETVMRVLSIVDGRAWCIDVDDPFAVPIHLSLNHISGLPSVELEHAAPVHVSTARLRKRDQAMERLNPLLQSGANLFLDDVRHHAIQLHAEEYGCSVRTLYKDLRRWWQRGQTEFALLPEYNKSGIPKAVEGEEPQAYTAGRGRPAINRKTYQVTATDIPKMRDAAEKSYLHDKTLTISDCHEYLQKKYYYFEDGNKQKHLRPKGEFPSYRQLLRFIYSEYDVEVIKRSRNGNADYDLNDRARLGTILADCRGIGHYFEIDATIGDIYLVSREDEFTIIGKPTIYTIRDRHSRLFVGFYFGLENASWNGAVQAILSISEDKEALCARYGVEYDPEHWPAHCVFPAEFLGDRGEMISNESNKVADNIHSTVANPPPSRADWKSTVEFGFKQIHATLRPVAPAYEPPLNAIRRRGKNYEKDACLTVEKFGNLFLNALISLNRKEAIGYTRSPAQIVAKSSTSPIALWNEDLKRRSGQLRKYSENFIRLGLLRRDRATVTDAGILFKGCYYIFPEAVEQKWFENARRRRFKVDVAYDTRLCDNITVLSKDGRKTYIATLMEKSFAYKGYSFEERRFVAILNGQWKEDAEHANAEENFNFRQRTEKTIGEAKLALENKPEKSRSGRKKDTKDARDAERTIERQETVGVSTKPSPGPGPGPGPALYVAASNPEPAMQPARASPANSSMKARMAAARNSLSKKDI